MKDPSTVTVNVSCPGIEDAARKATELKEKILEARTLVGELASIIGKLEIKADV